MNRRKNRKGFTLPELMLAVAIIVVLASLAFVGVARYLRGLRLLEMDNAAKEIYFAAQKRITAELVSGNLGRLAENDFSSDEEKPLSEDGKNVHVVRFPDARSQTATSLWDELLPFGAIDDTLRMNGYYIITYTFDAKNNLANVRDVWYTANNNEGFFRNWAGSEEALKDAKNDELLAARNDAGRKNRRNFPGGNGRFVIGHYGGDSLSLDRKNLGVTLNLINDEVLYLKGTVTVNGSTTIPDGVEPQVNIIVEGLTSGAIKTLVSKVTVDSNDGTFNFVLDDVTTANKRFRDQFAVGDEEGMSFIPGEDIRVTVEVYSNSELANIDRATAVDNSLFQYVKPETDSSRNITTAEAGIAKVRHLQNLSSEVSNVELGVKDGSHEKRLGINTAKQTDDLDWNKFVGFDRPDSTKINGNVYYNENNGINVKNTSASFLPIDLELKTGESFEKKVGIVEDESIKPKVRSFLYYDADAGYKVEGTEQRHKISNLTVSGTDHAGLFGSVGTESSAVPPETAELHAYLLTVKNLEMDLAKITGNATAATVAANVQRATMISGVSISKTQVTIPENKSGHAGGAVGKAVNGLDLLTVTVKGNTTNVTATNGNAGGLIGEFEGTSDDVHIKIDSCYVGGADNKDSKEITVTSDGTNAAAAGGLVGKITKGLPTIQNSYSTALVEGDTAGGLVGAIEECYTGSMIKSCYVGGHTDQGTDGKGTAKYATEAEKCNVKSTSSTGVSGGFIGSIGTSASNKLTVTASYTTASASGDQAGGFIGKTEANVSISNSYAVGLVVDKTPVTTASGAFVGNSTGTLTGEGNRYFELINGAMPAVVGSNHAATFVQSAETSLETYNDFVQLYNHLDKDIDETSERRLYENEFYPYDKTLGNMFGSKYFLPTASELTGADPKAPATHVGDWQPVDTLILNSPNG